MLAATRAADRTGFDAHVTERDPDFAPRADVWFANLSALSPYGVRFRVSASTAELGINRKDLLGPQAWVQKVVVEWRQSGSRETVELPIWLTFAADGDRGLLAGDGDAPAADRSAAWPTWVATPVQIARHGDVIVLGSGGDLPKWVQRGEVAAAAVRSQVRALGVRWSGPLVIEVPSTRVAFERSLGVADPSTGSGHDSTGSGHDSTGSGHGTYARIGAVAWPRGADRARAAVHVIVNPDVVAGLSEEGIAVLLAHEAAHVATRSVDSAAPTWLVEGLADQLAYAAHPATRRAAEEPLRRELGGAWRPTALPPESAFVTTGGRLDLAYAQSWSLCRLLSERYGPARLGRFYRSVDVGTPVPAALRAEFGLSPDELVRAWRAELSRLARS